MLRGVRRIAATHRISSGLAWTIILFPLIVVVLFLGLLWPQETRPIAKWLLQENRPVELLSSAALIAGGLTGLVLAWRTKRNGEPTFVTLFYAVFSLGLFVTGMEEIAWGQWLFDFETPHFLWEINRQREVTLHNIGPLQGHTEYLKMTFALGGLVGLCLSRWPVYRKIAVPFLLSSWIIPIAILAGIDLYVELFPAERYFSRNMGHYMSEVVEMLIGFVGLLYVWLNAKGFSVSWKSDMTAPRVSTS